jgi:hypothetical protein
MNETLSSKLYGVSSQTPFGFLDRHPTVGAEPVVVDQEEGNEVGDRQLAASGAILQLALEHHAGHLLALTAFHE